MSLQASGVRSRMYDLGDVRRCAFKGRRECAAVSIVVHRPRRITLPQKQRQKCSYCLPHMEGSSDIHCFPPSLPYWCSLSLSYPWSAVDSPLSMLLLAGWSAVGFLARFRCFRMGVWLTCYRVLYLNSLCRLPLWSSLSVSSLCLRTSCAPFLSLRHLNFTKG